MKRLFTILLLLTATLTVAAQQMRDAMDGVTAGYVSPSVRDVELNGVQVYKDDYIAFVDKEMVTSRSNKEAAAMDLIDVMLTMPDKVMITVFFGKDADHITHVAVAIDVRLMIEAGGGGSKCKTVSTSTGFVRVRPIDGRKDLVAVLRVYREN